MLTLQALSSSLNAGTATWWAFRPRKKIFRPPPPPSPTDIPPEPFPLPRLLLGTPPPPSTFYKKPARPATSSDASSLSPAPEQQKIKNIRNVHQGKERQSEPRKGFWMPSGSLSPKTAASIYTPTPPGSFCNALGEGTLGWHGGHRGVEGEVPPSGTWGRTHKYGGTRRFGP